MINYDTTRGSVTVQTDPGPTQSRLTIRQAVETDTGNYTCSASNTKPASIFVFVTEGKYKQHVSKRTKRTSLINITWPRRRLPTSSSETRTLVMILGRTKLEKLAPTSDSFTRHSIDRIYSYSNTPPLSSSSFESIFKRFSL